MAALVGSKEGLYSSIAYAAAVAFVEPFYVAAGFGLYLNRRVELEAWDIEQEFRRAFARAGGVSPMAVALLLLVLIGCPAAAAQPATPPGRAPERRGDRSRCCETARGSEPRRAKDDPHAALVGR